MMGKKNRAVVLDAWGDPPEWVLALADAADNSSQNRAAGQIGMSGSAVNQVLKNTYKGSLDNVEARVRGALLGETVGCPVLGEITRRTCLDWQGRPLQNQSAHHSRMWRACRGGCQHSSLSPDAALDGAGGVA